MEDTQIIAKGGQPAWEETVEHPAHGPLKFTVKQLPRNKDWLRHATLQEQIAPGLSASGGANAVFAAAVAGLLTFMELPVLDEQRDEDPDNPDHVKITLVRYDPLEDERIDFPVKVWMSFFTWRAELLSERTKEQVKNSSRVTSGDATDGSSPATTELPLPIPA